MKVSLAQFCMEYRMPQRRVHRLVSDAVKQSATEKGVDLQRGGWTVDLSQEIGVLAEQTEGATRKAYAVVDSHRLSDWIRKQLGHALLTQGDFNRIVEAARLMHTCGTGKSAEYYLLDRQSHQPFRPNLEYFERLDKALKRIGR